jgi:N-acyl-D-amino-acid deacylase
MRKMTMSPRSKFLPIGLLVLTWWPVRCVEAQRLITGRAGPGLERFDQIVEAALAQSRLPGAALAIAHDGRLVLARGYGFANLARGEPVRPESLFGLASVSKAITAVTILRLCDQIRLRLDDRVLDIIGPLRPPPGAREDPRLRTITIRQCLNHSGGWDRKKSGDPNSFTPRVARALGVRPPVTAVQLTRYMMGQPLDFAPGTEAHYSNFGFVLLGLVIERMTERPYVEAVEAITLRPMRLVHVRMTPPPSHYLPGEVHRYDLRTGRDLGGGRPPMMDAAGGWAASAVGMTRFLTIISRDQFLSDAMLTRMTEPPPPPIQTRPGEKRFGLGWDSVVDTSHSFLYFKGGSLAGIHTHIEHMPNGTDWALFVNGSARHEAGPDEAGEGLSSWPKLLNDVRETIRATKQWPSVNYFREYP